MKQNSCYEALEPAVYKALYDSDDHSGFEMTGQVSIEAKCNQLKLLKVQVKIVWENWDIMKDKDLK